jgi:hypothetical protein
MPGEFNCGIARGRMTTGRAGDNAGRKSLWRMTEFCITQSAKRRFTSSAATLFLTKVTGALFSFWWCARTAIFLANSEGGRLQTQQASTHCLPRVQRPRRTKGLSGNV